MNILINAKANSIVCRVAKRNIGKNYESRGHHVTYDHTDDYQAYDLIFFFAPEADIAHAREQNNHALIGLLDPKLNNSRDYRIASDADFLLVSSLEQQEFAQHFNKHVIVFNWFPETTPHEKQHTKGKNDLISIIYQGNKIHLNCCLNHVSKALEKIVADGYKIELRALYDIRKLGHWTIGTPHIPIQHIQWEEQTYCSHLATGDIGIVPNLLPMSTTRANWLTRVRMFPNFFNYNKNDYFLRFKMNSNPNRFWEYSQLGIPVVADMYPSACQVIQHETSGMLAYSWQGWYNAISRYIDKPRLRTQCALNLRKYMDQTLSPQLNFQRLNLFIDQLK